MRVEMLITAAQLHELVDANLQDGTMTWRQRDAKWFAHLGPDAQRAMSSWNTKNAGRPAFAQPNGSGYLHGGLFNGKLLAHRAIWALANDSWPTATIDHINGDRRDNRLCNLRHVEHVDNCRNQPRSSANKTGVTGVWFDQARRNYSASIMVLGKTIHIGRYPTIEAASSARAAANVAHGFHPNHGRKA